jgi:hypothetical protein
MSVLDLDRVRRMEIVVVRAACVCDVSAIGAMVSEDHGGGSRTTRWLSAFEQADSGIRRILLPANVAWRDWSCGYSRHIRRTVACVASGVARESPFRPIAPVTDRDAVRVAAFACAASLATTRSSTTIGSDGVRAAVAVFCGPTRIGTCRTSESGSGVLRRLRSCRVIGLVVTAFPA